MILGLSWLVYICTLLIAPFLVLGCIRKIKARLQNRIGAPIWQPMFDFIKLLRKGERISEDCSWILRGTTVLNLAAMILVAFMVPWIAIKPQLAGADLFLVIYLLAFMRFMTVLSAMDAGSSFGGFGASREVTLALLVEPATVLCLVALAVVAGTTDMNVIFAYSSTELAHHSGLWLLAGIGLFLSSIVDLSRMPVDDPTTHLELTMVHEAMILENSGKNLALTEWTHALKLTVLFGLCGQCLLHALPAAWTMNKAELIPLSFLAALFPAFVVALLEGTQVKLRWTKLPEFIAYAVAIAFISVFIAIGRV